MSTSKLSPQVIESLKEIIRDLGVQIAEDIEDEKAHHRDHHDHCTLHSSAHRLALQHLLDEHEIKILDTHPKYNNIIQLQVLKQSDPVSCGYYAFHNTFLTLKASMSKDPLKAGHYLKKLTNINSFQFRRRKLTEFLRNKVKEEGNKTYPWTESHLKIGVMERPYMEHLIRYFEESDMIGGTSCFLLLPDFGQQSLANSVMEPADVKKFQEIMDKFRTSTNYSHGFLVGVVNHWVAMVIIKKEDKTELYFLDSRNRPILTKTDDELLTIIKDHYDEREKVVKVDHRPWREQMFFLSMKDSQFAAELLYECAVGIRCFASFFLDLVVTSFASSFEEHVMPLSAECENDKKDELLAKLIAWNSSYFPPKMIEEGVLNKISTIGVNHLSTEKAQQLLRISHLIHQFVTTPNRLSNVMQSIVQLIQNK